jgi:hypothetical protein
VLVRGSAAAAAASEAGSSEGRPASSGIDVDGNNATSSYDTAGGVGTVTDNKGSITYAYDGGNDHRGLATGLTVSGVTGSFTAINRRYPHSMAHS